MATWALLLGVVPVPFGTLVAIGLGVSVLRRGRDGRNHGQVRAMVGIGFATLWILAGVAVASMGLVGQPDRDPAGAVIQPIEVQDAAVNVGDCLPTAIAGDTVSNTVAVTPCFEPHAAEVYATFQLAAGPFPGESQVTRLAEGGCAKRFQPFVGIGYGKSALDVMFLQPIQASWGQDRVVTCLLADKTPTTGTLKGSRR